MFLQNFINHYTDMWNSYNTIKERKYHLRILLEKKTGKKYNKNIKKDILVKELATYDYNIYNQKYEKYKYNKLTNRNISFYDKPQVGVSWIRQPDDELINPMWIKLIDNCSCPEFPDNLLCKYEINNYQRSLYINLQELYNGRQISRNTIQFRHILRHIKQQLKIENHNFINNYNFLSLLPEVLESKNYNINISESKFSSRFNSNIYEHQNNTADWMRYIENRVHNRKYIQYETELDYIYRWKDTNMYYNTRNDMIHIGYSKLQALMAFRGGMIATEDGLGKERICAKLIIDNPKKYNNMYGTLIICKNNISVDHWANELRSVSNPMLKVIVVKNTSQLKNSKSFFSEAEVVIVTHNIAEKLYNTTWYRVIFDDIQYIPYNINFPSSIYRWVLGDIAKYKLSFGNDHLKFLKHIFNLLQIDTQNPRRNNESSLVRKIYPINNNNHNERNYMNRFNTILDMSIIKTFFNNLYYRDIKCENSDFLPKIHNNIITYNWNDDEDIYYQELVKEYENSEYIHTRITLYKKYEVFLNNCIRSCNSSNINDILDKHSHLKNDLYFSHLLSIEEQIESSLNDNISGNDIYLRSLKDRFLKDLNTFNNLNKFRLEELERIKEKFSQCSQTCDICLDTCNEPVLLLNCMHFYCKKCIYQLNKHNSTNSMLCPKCKTSFIDSDKIIYYPNGDSNNNNLRKLYGTKISKLIELIEQLESSIIYTPNYEVKEYLMNIFEKRNLNTHFIITHINGFSNKQIDNVNNLIVFDDFNHPFKKEINQDLIDLLYHIDMKNDIFIHTFKDPLIENENIRN